LFHTMLPLLLAVLCWISLGEGAICPLQEHVVCNGNYPNRACLCAMSLHESPPPHPSCSHTDEKFEAISLRLKLDNTSKVQNLFPERQFRRILAHSLKTEEKSVVFLRFRCSKEEDGSEITVQFVVLKRGHDPPRMPFEEVDLMDPRTIVGRIKALQLTKLGAFEYEDVEKISKLYAVESFTDNTRLIIEACVAALFIFATCLCGCIIACRRNPSEEGYNDELQAKEETA